MNSQARQKVKGFPDTPGVYLFCARRRGGSNGKKILYVGKATSLRDRVRSYFNTDIVSTRSPLISKMLTEFTDIQFLKTDSVLEALVLEAHLIKKYQPEANIKEKDNKSFNYVVITDEDFPRVLIVRGRELEHGTTPSKGKPWKGIDGDVQIKYTFGPFPNGSQLKEAMKIVRKLFPFRDTCTPYNPRVNLGKVRGCFNKQIGLCPGVCTGEISKKEYAGHIKNIILFFESDKKKLIKNLTAQMKGFARAKEFEKAQQTKKTIYTLGHINDISLIKQNTDTRSTFRIESYDIAHLAGQNVVGVMTVVEGGEAVPAEYRKFKIKETPGVNDTKALKEILSRRLGHIEWRMPDLIVVDGGVAQKNAMEKILKDVGVSIPVVSVVKNEHHKAKEILGSAKYLVHEQAILLSNTEAHRFAIGYHKKLRTKTFLP